MAAPARKLSLKQLANLLDIDTNFDDFVDVHVGQPANVIALADQIESLAGEYPDLHAELMQAVNEAGGDPDLVTQAVGEAIAGMYPEFNGGVPESGIRGQDPAATSEVNQSPAPATDEGDKGLLADPPKGDDPAPQVNASDAARRLAEKEGIDLTQITPANGKQITQKDVLLARKSQAEGGQKAAAPAAGTASAAPASTPATAAAAPAPAAPAPQQAMPGDQRSLSVGDTISPAMPGEMTTLMPPGSLFQMGTDPASLASADPYNIGVMDMLLKQFMQPGAGAINSDVSNLPLNTGMPTPPPDANLPGQNVGAPTPPPEPASPPPPAAQAADATAGQYPTLSPDDWQSLFGSGGELDLLAGMSPDEAGFFDPNKRYGVDATDPRSPDALRELLDYETGGMPEPEPEPPKPQKPKPGPRQEGTGYELAEDTSDFLGTADGTKPEVPAGPSEPWQQNFRGNVDNKFRPVTSMANQFMRAMNPDMETYLDSATRPIDFAIRQLPWAVPAGAIYSAYNQPVQRNDVPTDEEVQQSISDVQAATEALKTIKGPPMNMAVPPRR